jgi:hypothetical protein
MLTTRKQVIASSMDAKNEGGRGYVQLTLSSSSGCTQFLGDIKNRWERVFALLASKGGGCFFASPSFRGGRFFASFASIGGGGCFFAPFALKKGGSMRVFCFGI